MILYCSDALAFKMDVDTNQITEKIEHVFSEKLGFRPSPSERHSWANSMQFMERIIRNSGVPDDCGILIEFNIPSTSKRIDFMITGQDQQRRDNFVIIELKQWEKAQALPEPNLVKTFIGGGDNRVTHPSYQAWSYKQFMTDMNEAIHEGEFEGQAAVYLHNYSQGVKEPLLSDQYLEIVREAPLFFREDYAKLQEFLYRRVCTGRGINTMYLIEKGRLRPSKKLMDYVGRLFDGQEAFVLLDEQKVAYEVILSVASKASRKTVVIVEGGPGTGKSVISLNAFGQLLQRGKNIKFVAPNAAFRSVVLETLAKGQNRNKVRLKNLFSGSAAFWDSPNDTYDVLVVDEAHRLKNATAYMYKGQNQVEDVIRAARVSVLFVDNNQQIRPEDIGSTEEIRRLANEYEAEIVELKLQAQFRCAGAEGFINWISDVLQIEHTGNYDGWDQDSFEFKLCDSPHEVFTEIRERAQNNNKARMLAGYAWPWTSEAEGNTHGQVADVCIAEHNFAMPWNQRTNTSIWALQSDGICQIGCIHTSQGLEFDYVGVLIGYDLRFDPKSQRVRADRHEYKDKPGMKGLSNKPEELNRLIKNIYKVLCSRGIKGCFIYCRDTELHKHFERRLCVATENSCI